MQIRSTSVRLVRLNFGLSLYLDRTFGLSLSLSLSPSGNFGLRPKFRLSERLSEITSLFDLSLVLDRTLARRKAQRKAKSKSEVAHCHIAYLLISDRTDIHKHSIKHEDIIANKSEPRLTEWAVRNECYYSELLFYTTSSRWAWPTVVTNQIYSAISYGYCSQCLQSALQLSSELYLILWRELYLILWRNYAQ